MVVLAVLYQNLKRKFIGVIVIDLKPEKET